ncbi:MAG: inorganic phosphate transporter [bacterium]|nr:inorganic phosphate transporter [bacterium]
MGLDSILLTITIGFGFYMAWNIGANDVANAMGTSVGSRALTLKQAVILAAILEFAGAFLVGSHVTDTVRKGMFDPLLFSDDIYNLAYGMMAALLAAGAWLNIATFFGWPVSTSHSIVGAIIGFVLIQQGFHAVSWSTVGSIAASWVISPLLSGSIAYFIFKTIRAKIFRANDPVKATKKAVPFLVFSVFMILTLVMVFKGLKNLNLDLQFSHAILLSVLVGIIFAAISIFVVKKYKFDPESIIKKQELAKDQNKEQVVNGLKRVTKDLFSITKDTGSELRTRISKIEEEVKGLISEVKKSTQPVQTVQDFDVKRQYTEKIFTGLQILSACFVAFAHGANDVANAIGPIAAVVEVLKTKTVSMEVEVAYWILALGGLGIVIGLATWGYKVIFTIGEKLTELTPSRGFTAEFSAAITIVFASKLGLPISTTHTLVGAVLGVGFARGVRSLNLKLIRDIISSWFITLPAAAIIAIIIFNILKWIF